MKTNELVQSENLLKEIIMLRTHLSELYSQKGPNCSDYISLSLKQNLLINEYFEEKMLNFK